MNDLFGGFESSSDLDLGTGTATCSAITQDEIDEAESFGAMLASSAIELKASAVQEHQVGEARSKNFPWSSTPEHAGHGPTVISDKDISMTRLLWADGLLTKKDKKSGRETQSKATLAVFKVITISKDQDSPIKEANFRVEFHGTGPGADRFDAKRPVVVGWAPFAALETSNETTAEETRNRSLTAGLHAGNDMASASVEATASNQRVWTKSYFDVSRSWPVTVLGTTGESSNFNGVQWHMEHNKLAAKGVRAEILVYLLFTRQDDSDYIVKITANTNKAKLLGSGDHKCVLRVTPKPPSNDEPLVCYLEGRKMWDELDVFHYEALLTSDMDSSLTLPWEKKEEEEEKKDDEKETKLAGSAKANATDTPTDAATKNGNGSENQTAKRGAGGVANDFHFSVSAKVGKKDEEEEESEEDENPSVAVTLKETRETKVTEKAEKTEKTEAKAKTTTKEPAGAGSLGSGLSSDLQSALLEILSAPKNPLVDEDENMAARVERLEARLEEVEYRMARQALVIRALLKSRGTQ